MTTVATDTVVTDEQITIIQQALQTLDEIAHAAADAAWRKPSDSFAAQVGALAQDYGRLAGVANIAADVLFDVLNVAHTYRVRPDMTEQQLYGGNEEGS